MIVRLTGGMANQFFMYAFGRSLSLRRNEPVTFEWRRSTWDYALDAYNVNVRQGVVLDPKRIYEEPSFAYDPNVWEQPSDTYFKGYWQSAKYFERPGNLRRELTLKERFGALTEGTADSLASQNSCFIHVRRGDYASNPSTAAFHGFPGLHYYYQAIEYVKEKVQDPVFYLFSDDPLWCMQNFPYPVFSVVGGNQHEDLYLMRNCRHGIGANSTFSWWANWLGEHPDRVSIAPKKWFTDETINTNDLIPENWIRL